MKILLFLIIILPSIARTQTILPEINGVIEYTDVVDADSVSKIELFNRAIVWIASNYNSANKVIQMQDKEAGVIIAKGNFVVSMNTAFVKNIEVRVAHTLKLFFKDGKYKYDLSDFGYYADDNVSIVPIVNNASGLGGKPRGRLLDSINEKVELIISNLKEALSKPIQSSDF